ncbi:MAG: hypothetical protein E7058_03935 [Lentisphaerae bacterium]|nr:hypothetical protein [Lentisphaerota bacterium]
MSKERDFLRVSSWYTALAPYTWDTKFVKLRSEAVAALASGMDAEAAKNFLYTVAGKATMNDLAVPMGDIPGNAFVFVDTCAPTDTERFASKGGAVYSPRSALFYLLQSKKIANAAANGEVEYVCLRPFRNITKAREFRLFIYEGELSAMSQYHLIRHFRRLEGVKSNYWSLAQDFVKNIVWRIPVKTLVIDIYITSSKDILIIDLNRWGECDPLLLRSWERDWRDPAGIQVMAPPTEVSGDVKVSF